jgi:ribosomal protein S18 acetylase RimI-like enzyme
VETTWQKAIDDGLRIQYLFYLGEGKGVHVVKEAPPNAELLAMIAADIEDLYATKDTDVASREKGIAYGASCVVEKQFRAQGWANALNMWLQDEVIRMGAKQVEREHRAWKTGWNVKIFSASVISDNEAVISVLQRKDYEEVKRVENYYENHELQASLGDHVSIFFKKRVTDEERLEALGCNDSYALGDEGQLIRLRPRSKL